MIYGIRLQVIGFCAALILFVARCVAQAPAQTIDNTRLGSVTTPSASSVPPQSRFFSTAAEESYSTYQLSGDGDLWPSCWADDDNLYTANGDGTAFSSATTRYDMAVSVLHGLPPNLRGTTIATDVGTNWSGKGYNRKPTGMLCIHGAIYLAFQNLSLNFTDTPAASIAKSTDHGATWSWDTNAPMFGAPGNASSPLAHKFTTVFFLDYGKNSANARDGYVYAYGLDDNWRAQQALYLARVPSDKVLSRQAWEFYTGINSRGVPTWSSDITQKAAVLTDKSPLYPIVLKKKSLSNQHAIGQGGVVYDAPLHRYLFASWSESTHQFYDAPNPWGPWSRFLATDFGPLKSNLNYGQYGTNIPSKFISADGKTLYLQSNIWYLGYSYALRRVYLQPYTPSSPQNPRSGANLAHAPGTRAISKSTRFGSLCGLDCSDQLSSGVPGNEDDYDGEAKTLDWWGYIWPQAYRINRVVYETGDVVPEGGWFQSNLRVQVRRNFQWVDAGVAVVPAYPYSIKCGRHTRYTFNLSDTWGDGVRIIGTPGGTSHFTSISQLSVYYVGK